MKRKKWIGLIIFFIAVGIGTVFSIYRSQTEFLPVKRGNIEEAVYGLGKVKSNKVYELKVGVAATISKLFVREGDTVVKGQKLIRFDQGVTVSAPFSGVITFLPFHEKENTFPQGTILRIEDLNDLYVEVSLEQQGALRVRKGQMAKLSFESLRGTLIGGGVEAIFPKDDQFVVRIKSGDLPQGVLSGMTADVAIEVGRKKNVLLIPLVGVSNGRMTVVRNGVREKIKVKIGAADGDWAEIIEGEINENDQVIIPKR